MTDKDATPGADALTQQMFGRVLEPDRPAPTLDYDALRYGAIVVHRGIRVIEYKREGKDRKTKLHLFATRGGGGPWFSVFGTANLDSQLRKAKPGAVLLLQYAGKQPVGMPDQTEQEQHVWHVRETVATPAQVAQLRARPEWVERELALDTAIVAAAVAERERRNGNRAQESGTGHDDAPPLDDGDLPPWG